MRVKSDVGRLVRSVLSDDRRFYRKKALSSESHWGAIVSRSTTGPGICEHGCALYTSGTGFWQDGAGHRYSRGTSLSWLHVRVPTTFDRTGRALYILRHVAVES